MSLNRGGANADAQSRFSSTFYRSLGFEEDNEKIVYRIDTSTT